jgi:uncharacterized protein with von Willebrand factor type A (vWA) domain
MPSRSKARKPKAIYVPSVPAHTGWLEADSYDRWAWQQLNAQAPTIAELVESGERLVPHFGSLLRDLFFALFKYNLVWLQPGDVRSSATLNRTILADLIASPVFAALKERTLLEEDKAAIAALALAEQAIELVRAERLINRREMLDLWDLKHQEDELNERARALEGAMRLESETKAGESQPDAQAQLGKKVEELKAAAARAAQVSEARLNQKARAVQERLSQARLSELKRLQLKAGQLAGEIDQVASDSHDFGLEFGQAGRLSAGERLELGRRLAKNRKIGELARLVGRFKQDALALRRKIVERGQSEVLDIERGADLGRLIPAELIALHQPELYRDFKRRLLEGELLQYQLRDDEQKGKGPMVVCLDVSSSMQGDKELWGKAVTLTLMDIARRQRRLFRAVLFSSGADSLRVIDVNRERRYEPELGKVMELAEYFPGGGTEFERPLDAAMELIAHKKLRRADIVIITDGECQVSPQWLAALNARKQELQFKIFGVLVDVGTSELSTLRQFSDRVASIKALTAQGTREIFLNI